MTLSFCLKVVLGCFLLQTPLGASLTKKQEIYWEEKASSVEWFKPHQSLCRAAGAFTTWYEGGLLNASYNCLDRHLQKNGSKRALLWEGERGDKRSLTYKELHAQVCRFSNVLKSLGVQKGDRVAIYLPQIPEAVIAMLASARIGAVHTVVFAGFSSEALKERLLDAEAKVVITADASFRKGKPLLLKKAVDQIIDSCPSVKHQIVVDHCHQNISFKKGRDVWYHEAMEKAPSYCSAAPMQAEDLLFILYTSGTTAKPKGVMHTTGGYMVGATTTTQLVFKPHPEDIFWCTADVGWITGHTYVVYGPLSNAMTVFLYEGSLDQPDKGRAWKLIEDYHITTFYTAPTAIRTFMKWGESYLTAHNLSSLRLLATVGEPINPDVWQWYYTYVGQKKCPVLDTWWQTETGSIMIAPIHSPRKVKPGSATRPMPGIEMAVLTDAGEQAAKGNLAITAPWPSMLRGLYKDEERYLETYWKKWQGRYYFTGDGATVDEEGDYWLLGRIDDVMNVSGHRLSTIEIENALIENAKVVEAAAVAISHPVKGQAIVCFAVLKEGSVSKEHLEEELKECVVKKIGSFARPERILFICELPKTRSGKIMRRLLRAIAEGGVLGDTSTLSDPEVVEAIKKDYAEEEAT